MSQRLATSDEVAERLQLSRIRLERMARAGEVPAIILPGGEVRFEESELAEWLRTRRQQRSEPAK